jgi:integrase/recombinase XerD
MGIDDPQQFSAGLQNERDRLQDSDITDDGRTTIEQWLRRKDGSVAVSSLKTYLRRIRLAAERSDSPLHSLDEQGMHDLVWTLRHDHDLSDATVKSYENAVLMFIDDMTAADWTDEYERTTVDTGGPSVEDILTPDDLHQLTASARHQRDVAFIEFLADTGARLSLALSLRVGDVDLGAPPTYRPHEGARGLKGAEITEYPLIDSASTLRSYLRTSHPRPDRSDVALFHKLKPASRDGDSRWTDAGAVAPAAMTQQLKRVADRAGVDKPTNPHAFRHAAITRMVREGYSRSQIEHRVHWTLDTDMWDTYEHITSAEHNEDIFREAGLLDEVDGPDRVRKACGTCNRPLAPHHEYCPNCGQPATPGAQERTEETVDTILDAMVAESNPAAVDELRALVDELREYPVLAERHDDPS